MTKVGTGATFTLKFIPKVDYDFLDSATLVDKDTGATTALVKDSTIYYYDRDWYVEADVSKTVVEDEHYLITILDDQGNEAYVGSVFVTDQTTYEINDGVYVEPTQSDEYKTP